MKLNSKQAALLEWMVRFGEGGVNVSDIRTHPELSNLWRELYFYPMPQFESIRLCSDDFWRLSERGLAEAKALRELIDD